MRNSHIILADLICANSDWSPLQVNHATKSSITTTTWRRSRRYTAGGFFDGSQVGFNRL